MQAMEFELLMRIQLKTFFCQKKREEKKENKNPLKIIIVTQSGREFCRFRYNFLVCAVLSLIMQFPLPVYLCRCCRYLGPVIKIPINRSSLALVNDPGVSSRQRRCSGKAHYSAPDSAHFPFTGAHYLARTPSSFHAWSLHSTRKK